MTIVRAIDSSGDWLFGKSLNDYVSKNAAVQQDIKTRILEFLGNCFFNTVAGIDWFNLLGSKNELALSLAISAVILNTENVTSILQLRISLNAARALFVSYQVQTTYSVTGSSFQYDLIGAVAA